MLEAVLGSSSAERVLLFLTARGEGYATDIARVFGTDLSPIQKQLERMERDGLLINQKIGRTRIYRLNPRYAFIDDVKQMMEHALELCPDKLRDKLILDRRRPRKKDKPL